jgi:hypothetical protein
VIRYSQALAAFLDQECDCRYENAFSLPMTADAPREKNSAPKLFRVFAWFLCLLLVGGMGGSRWTGLAALAVLTDAGRSSTEAGSIEAESIEACNGHMAADCDLSHGDSQSGDSQSGDSQSGDSQSGDSQNDAESQAHSDLEPVEALTVPELQIDLAPPGSTEISTPYSGQRRSVFSSPEPRPAERA